MPRLPVLFLSHGSPMHALEPGAVGAIWRELGHALPRPAALLVASAHWETGEPQLSGSAQPGTIHDFYGFPEPLYRIRYNAPGAPQLAARAADLLKRAGFSARIDGGRGLDHGAWSPLLHMYPDAHLPVVQLSLQTDRGPRHHLALGRALSPLADEGILIVGSGHMTHNLRDRMDPADNAYARAFQQWASERIEAGELDALANYRKLTPHGARAHPTEEHFLPLFVALGAAGERCRAMRLYDGVENGVLAMDQYRFDPS